MAITNKTSAAHDDKRAYKDILFEVKDQVAWVTINRPEVMNAFREQTLDEMIDDMGPHESRNYVRMVAGHFLRYLAIYETPRRAEELRAELLPADWKAAWLPYPDY